MADFVSDLRKDFHVDEKWVLYADGSSSKKGSGASIVLEGGNSRREGFWNPIIDKINFRLSRLKGKAFLYSGKDLLSEIGY